jgi:hypothetical protein
VSTPYNQVAGQNADRVAALRDGVFAVTMTLLAVVQLYFIVTPRIPGLDRLLWPGDHRP